MGRIRRHGIPIHTSFWLELFIYQKINQIYSKNLKKTNKKIKKKIKKNQKKNRGGPECLCSKGI